jgi:uncharacterized protein
MNRNATRFALAWAILACLALGQFATAQDQPERKQPPQLSAADIEKIEAALPTATVKTDAAHRILVFWRCEGFFHGGGIAAGNKAIEMMGKKNKLFRVDCTDDYAAFDADNLAKYDAVVLNNTTRLKLTPDMQKALLDFVRSGNGFIGIHAAADNFYDWPEGANMVGGLFDGHPWGGGGTWAFRLDAPDHILTKAFAGKGFKLQDEIYQYKDPYTRKDRRVLLTLDLADEATGGVTGGVKRTDKDFAVAWIKTEGKGRVFFCGLGHGPNVFMDAPVMQFFLDGVQYALGDLKADASP